MRRLAVFLSLLCLLSLPVSAAYIPESSVTENRDGRQLIIKTYQLSPEDDPSELVDEPFDLEGYHYEHLETVKEDQTFHDSKAHTETVTVTTSSDSLAAILEQLAPTMEYSKDGYSGVLTLDHTTLQTEAAGYTTKYYTITDTKQFTGLPRNDPSYVPTTTVKDGKTLSLSNISWAVTGTGLADDTLVPTSYTATATYQATDGDGYYNTDYGDVTFEHQDTPVVYYNQTDARWGNKLYGKTGTIGAEGCGPTALAIVVATLVDSSVTPYDVAKWSAETGHRCEGNGSYHSLIPDGGAHYGLTVTGIGNNSTKLVEALQDGKLVIALMSKGHFTNGGHFIVLRGITEDGKILVADPASVKRSNQEWELGIVVNEARRGAAAGGPFWVFS